MLNSLVIIPTYQEKENITRILQSIFELSEDVHVLIIDDGSPDGTAEIVKSLQSTYNQKLHLLQRTGKLGLGTAYITGFKWAIERGYDFIFEMDADFSHPPKDLVRLYDACKNGADVSVGSRYARGGKVKNWPLNRVLMSYFASVYVRMITWLPVKDTTAGFVCYTKKFLSSIDLQKIRFVGYAFQIEMKYAAWKSGFKIKEIPITFIDRKEGVSKMSTGIFKEALRGVIKMRFGTKKNFYAKN